MITWSMFWFFSGLFFGLGVLDSRREGYSWAVSILSSAFTVGLVAFAWWLLTLIVPGWEIV